MVITGEGRLDAQTAYGKAPIGVAKLAKKYGKTVLAFAGTVTEDASVCTRHGIDAFYAIKKEAQSLQEAMNPAVAKENMIQAVQQVLLFFNKAEKPMYLWL